MVSAEYAPLAKTGGLADSVAGLSQALHARGHDVRVVLPSFGRPLPAGWSASPLNGAADAGFLEARSGDSGPVVYLLDAPEVTGDGEIYTGDERDAARFCRFCRGALELAQALDWRPDVVHCHDWHAAPVTALMRTAAEPSPFAAARSMLTLHNIGYQGAFPRAVLEGGGCKQLVETAGDDDLAAGLVVFLKIGIRHADLITTVSPTYAREILTPEQGMGLEELLQQRGDDLVGILNGVDYRLWSPESDPYIEPSYGRGETAGKRRVKRALCEGLGLPDDAPVIGVVTRLVEQKGLDLLVDALPTLLERTRARFALLGSGEPALEDALHGLAGKHLARIAFRRGYDEALAHRILAGSDLLLVPSRYEPCGLTQLYALRYGTIPVVRATGGLADTVAHFDPETGEGTGSVFEHADPEGLIWGVTTALDWYDDAPSWRRLMDNAMRADYSWERQAEPYEALYQRLLGRTKKKPRRPTTGP